VERGSEEKRFKKSLCIIYCDTDGEKKNDSCCPVWCTTQRCSFSQICEYILEKIW